MYSYISGTLEEINEDSVVIDAGGVGYEIFVSSLLKNHLPTPGSEVKLYTHLAIREDAHTLYGFLSKSEKKMFLLLTGVNGIGPKNALSILSLMEVEDLKFAILSEDSKTLGKANGVGPKTAQRIIIELKDRISLEETFEEAIGKKTGKDSADLAEKNDAILALSALGYSNTEILKALNRVGDVSGFTVQKIITAALKFL